MNQEKKVKLKYLEFNTIKLSKYIVFIKYATLCNFYETYTILLTNCYAVTLLIYKHSENLELITLIIIMRPEIDYKKIFLYFC